MRTIIGISILAVIGLLAWLIFFKKPSTAEQIASIKKEIHKRLPNAGSSELTLIDLAVDDFAKSFPDKVQGLYDYFVNGKTSQDATVQSTIDKILS